MHDTSYKKMQAFVELYLGEVQDKSLAVFDIGARSVQGMPTYRPLFDRPGWRYTGLDVSPGDNVDVVVADPYRWTELSDGCADVIISGQALEHIEFPWLTFGEIARILKPGGLACIIVPSSGPEHRFPVDCWRFLPDSMKALARSSGLHLVEVFTDWGLLPWQDTFAVMQKPGSGKTADSSVPLCNNHRAAFSVYQTAINSRPKTPVYYQKLAALLTAKGDGRSAAMALRVGIEQVPANHELRAEAVRSLIRCGNTSAAIEQAVALLGMRPITPASADAAGDAFAALDASQRDFYSNLLPAERPVLQRLAELANTGGRFALSAACWSRLAAEDPGDPGKGLRFALAQFGTGERKAALAHFRELRRRQVKSGEINRTTVLQRLIDDMGARVYLEIGVESGINFFQIEAPIKLAVDPRFRIPGGAADFDGHLFFNMESDAFFKDPPPELLRNGLDVALIDGLHTYEQALRDVENCLRFLNPEGVIVVHDCLPANEAEACPSIEEARLHPGFKIDWTGDVYRTIIHLRALKNDVTVAVLNTDHGIGLVERGISETALDLSIEDIRNIGYHDLAANAGSLINLKPAQWFNQWLASRLR